MATSYRYMPVFLPYHTGSGGTSGHDASNLTEVLNAHGAHGERLVAYEPGPTGIQLIFEIASDGR